MSLAGLQLLANRIPGERIATTISTANSGAITAEAITDTVVAALVTGRTYRITFSASLSGGAAERALIRIREDNLAGTILQTARMGMAVATNYYFRFEAEFTAVATGNKTFAVTVQRETAVANVIRIGNAAQPVHLYVDYIRG